MVSGLCRLRSLVLTRVDLSSVRLVTTLFTGLPCLEALELDSTGITDAGIAALTYHGRPLRYLMVGSHEPGGHARVTDRGMASIASLLTLEALDVAFQSKITTEGVRIVLQRLSRLRYLNLDGTGADDATAHVIAKHASALEWLSIQSCRVTDEGLGRLADLPALREMGVTYCESLTPACVPLLMRSPSLETVELLDATRTAGISREQAESIANTYQRADRPDLNMFCWTIGSIGEHYLPGSLAEPVFRKRTMRWILKDSSDSAAEEVREITMTDAKHQSQPSHNATAMEEAPLSGVR